MEITTEEATALGKALWGYLTNPRPDLTEVPVETRIESLLGMIEQLQAAGALSETQRGTLVEFVTNGSQPTAGAEDSPPVGRTLITTAQRYPYYGSTVVDVYAALAAVADAAAHGLEHGGSHAARACAAIAAVEVIAEGHKQLVPPGLGHKDSGPLGHKQVLPTGHKE